MLVHDTHISKECVPPSSWFSSLLSHSDQNLLATELNLAVSRQAAGLATELVLLADVALAGGLASDLVGLIIIVVVQAVLRNKLARAAYRMWRFWECAYLVAIADSDGARVTGRLGQAASGHDGGSEKGEREAKEDGGAEGEHVCALLC